MKKYIKMKSEVIVRTCQAHTGRYVPRIPAEAKYGRMQPTKPNQHRRNQTNLKIVGNMQHKNDRNRKRRREKNAYVRNSVPLVRSIATTITRSGCHQISKAMPCTHSWDCAFLNHMPTYQPMLYE